VAGKVPGFFEGSWTTGWFPVGFHRFLGPFYWSWMVPQVPGWFLKAPGICGASPPPFPGE